MYLKRVAYKIGRVEHRLRACWLSSEYKTYIRKFDRPCDYDCEEHGAPDMWKKLERWYGRTQLAGVIRSDGCGDQ